MKQVEKFFRKSGSKWIYKNVFGYVQTVTNRQTINYLNNRQLPFLRCGYQLSISLAVFNNVPFIYCGN